MCNSTTCPNNESGVGVDFMCNCKKELKVIICGDIHGDWRQINTLINHKNPDVILQVGDFGWWPHFHNTYGFSKKKKFDQFGIKNHSTKIAWIPGNHENWDDLKCITDYEPLEIQDNITYCPFGTVLEINNQKILCCGGAESIDKEWRKEGVSWWKGETITQGDMDNLPDCDIDVVISHTAPRNWIENSGRYSMDKQRDPSSFALQLIFERYRPKKWFNGHFHYYMNAKIDGCEWVSLDMAGNLGKWWTKL